MRFDSAVLKLVLLFSLPSLPALQVAAAQQSAAPAAELPRATDVIARFVKAAHLDNIKAHTSSRSTAKVEIPSLGITGTVVEMRLAPNLVMATTALTGRGESKSGFDGERGWSVDPSNGPRLMSPEEANDMKVSATFFLPLRDTTLYKTRETVELAEFGGQKCWRLRMVTHSGRESFDCFSVETGLLIAAQRKSNSPMGQVDNVSQYSEYKDFGGIMLASKIVMDTGPIRRVLTVQNVVYDDVKADEVAPPPSVKALIKP